MNTTHATDDAVTKTNEFAADAFERGLILGYVFESERATFASDLAGEIAWAIREGWTVDEFLNGFVK